MVDAILLAQKSSAAVGQIYNITDGRSYEMREIIEAIAEETGSKRQAIAMPVALGKMLGYGMDVMGKIFNFLPPFSRGTALWMSSNMNVYDCSKAKRELDYRPAVKLREGIRRTVRWYRTNGLLS